MLNLDLQWMPLSTQEKILCFLHIKQLTSPSRVKVYLFFLCCRSAFLLFRIMSWSLSRPSLSPSPMIAQAGCRCHGVAGPSSFSASSFSISASPKECLKSCLLATTSRGTPWFSEVLAILWSSVLASSMRSASTESTTNMMPSVHRVYDFHRGRSFSWPPTSQKWNVPVLCPPRDNLTFSALKPLVGTVFTNSLNCSLYRTVVFPAESRPRMAMWKDWKNGMLEMKLGCSDNPFPIFPHGEGLVTREIWANSPAIILRAADIPEWLQQLPEKHTACYCGWNTGFISSST